MAMICGLDLHRGQITFDALVEETGELWRGRLWSPDRVRFRRWLAQEVAPRAAEIGLPFTVTVIDAGTHLVAVARMDGAVLGSIEVSATKARTAVLFGQQTKDLNAAVQPGAPMFSIERAIREPVTFAAGGIPLTDDRGLVIGAIGVSGGAPDQDQEVAVAAATV